jgi:hypothetical protein
MSKFIYLEVQIVGNVDNWGYAYYSDLIENDNIASAVRYSYKVLGHDDFIIAEIEGKKLICLYNLNGKKRVSKKEFDGVKEEFNFK